MSGRTMTTDAALDTTPTSAPALPRRSSRSWEGIESSWVMAARAAAPWPLWSLLAVLAMPGASHVPAFMHGVLALSAVLATMVWVSHRPNPRALGRWTAAVLGTGLMGELLANALTDMGREAGLATLEDPARGIAVWVLCVAVYEVAPIVATSSRLTRTEQRPRSLDVVAHLTFVLLAAAAYAFDPSLRGDASALWRLSPWMAVAIALPFAAARCGPDRDATLPSSPPVGASLWPLVPIAWGLLIAMIAGEWSQLSRAVWELRWGATPLEGVLLVMPAVSLVFSAAAAAVLLARAWLVRRAPRGTVADIGQGGVTIEREGIEEPSWVAVESGPLPERGAVVTLLGARLSSPDAGPFRDGVHRWLARRVWLGSPKELARVLTHRAAAWLGWAALCAMGILIQLW